jgi:hypothetical protein
LTKKELHDFAAAGVANRIKDIERELAEYHRGWPMLFLTKTPPQLLIAASRNGNGHWPPVTATPRKGNKPRETGGAIAARRSRTAALLAQFDQTTPRHATGLNKRGFGTLVRHGFLKRKSNGYIRTAKAFSLTRGKAAHS